MSIELTKINTKVKDPVTGEMLPFGLFGSDSLTLINQKKEESLQEMETKHSESIAEMETKRVNALESIPNDYTTLANDVSDLKEDLSELVPGLSDVAKDALLACFRNVAWKGTNGVYYYNALQEALTDNSGYIGTLTFPLGAESSMIRGGRFVVNNTISVRSYNPSIQNRIYGNLKEFNFKVGDVIDLDDTDTYSMAIGTDRNGVDSWIGGGYLTEYPFIVTAENINDVKKYVIKKTDNADMTQEDLDYLSAHITLTRVINNTLTNLTCSYDGETVYTENDNYTFIRPHFTVTAFYSDGTSEVITLYTMSGVISTGQNTIRIKYGNRIIPVSVSFVELDYFLKRAIPDIGLAQWGRAGQTPEDNDGYIAPSTADVDKLSYNISGISFNADDVIHFDYRDKYSPNVKYAMGTNKANTSVNNRTWIANGFLTVDEYTLEGIDLPDMKIIYVRSTNSTSDISSDITNNRIVSNLYRELHP